MGKRTRYSEEVRGRAFRRLRFVGAFTSKRERRLWLWGLAVAAAIFSTLGFTGRPIEALRNSGIVPVAFVLGMCLVGAGVLTQGLKVRPRGIEVGVVLGIAAAYFMMFIRVTLLAERTHLIEYGVLAVIVFEALTERAGQGRRIPLPGLFAVLASSLVGVADELLQLLLPDRVFDPQDILFNFLAGLMAVAACSGLHWARQRSRHRRGVGRRTERRVDEPREPKSE